MDWNLIGWLVTAALYLLGFLRFAASIIRAYIEDARRYKERCAYVNRIREHHAALLAQDNFDPRLLEDVPTWR